MKYLIAGPDAYICDGCAGRAQTVLATPGRTESTPVATIVRVTAGGGDEWCSFCGKSHHLVEAMAAAGDARICTECLDLCDDIIADSPG